MEGMGEWGLNGWGVQKKERVKKLKRGGKRLEGNGEMTQEVAWGREESKRTRQICLRRRQKRSEGRKERATERRRKKTKEHFRQQKRKRRRLCER